MNPVFPSGQALSVPGHVARPIGVPRMPQSIVGVDAALRHARQIETVARPIVAMDAQYPDGGSGTMHSHRRAQFMLSAAGSMSVATEAGNWLLPPQHALLIPAGVMHRTRYCGAARLHTLYLEPVLLGALPAECRLIAVSPLLRELVCTALTFPAEYALEGRQALVMNLLASEIGQQPAVPLHVPMPHDRRLLRICEAIQQDPGAHSSVDDWTSIAGLSRRTLARQFQRETGMSFTEWRIQVRLLEALRRIAEGQPIGSVALDLGYETASAFSVMFKRKLGISPSEYLRRCSG